MRLFECRTRIWIACMMVFAPGQLMHGQIVNGTILGTVRDPSGGVIPQVNVSAKNVNTGAARTAISDTLGAYQILNVPAGDYEVEAVVQGFKTSVRRGINVTVGGS